MATNPRPYMESAAEFVDKISPGARLDQDADMIVQAMYRDLDDDTLRLMLIHGNEFESQSVVDALNAAIQKELDRRAAERVELEAER